MQREYHEQLQQQEHAQTRAQQAPDDVAVGPWDRTHGASYAAVARPSYLVGGGNPSSTIGATGNVHPSSSSERSTSPGSFLDAHHGPGQAPPQGGYIPQFQHLRDQQKLLLQRQSQQFGQQHGLHNIHHNQGYRTQSESSETSAIEAVNLGVAGYLRKPFRVPEVLAAAAKALGVPAE